MIGRTNSISIDNESTNATCKTLSIDAGINTMKITINNPYGDKNKVAGILIYDKYMKSGSITKSSAIVLAYCCVNNWAEGFLINNGRYGDTTYSSGFYVSNVTDSTINIVSTTYYFYGDYNCDIFGYE